MLPSYRYTPLKRPSQSLTTLSAIVSKTGWRSVGELEMTRRISLVAVCCSSDCGQLAVPRGERLGEPLVLEGDRRLIGEGPEELHLLRGERRERAPAG